MREHHHFWFRSGLLAFLIALAIPPALRAEPFDACGRLGRFYDCWVLSTIDSSGEDYWIENAGAFQDGDYVHVTGEVVACQHTCNWYTFPECLVDNTIEACAPQPLGCGVLADTGLGCWLWTSPTWGALELPPPEFAPGDTVQAVGIIDRSCGSVCMVGQGCLVDADLSACTDPTPAASRSWGRIKQQYR